MHKLACALGLVLGIAACSKNEVGCTKSPECAPGQVCVSNRCAQLCNADAQCSAGTICEQGVCAPGTRQVPRIDSVVGGGSASCPAAESGYCFTDRFTVLGAGLSGASFSLDSTATGSIALTRTGTPVDGAVSLVLPGNLPRRCAGDSPLDYTLTASNAAGTDQATVHILQGEPCGMTGDAIIDQINTSPFSSRLMTARLPLADALISHLNGGGTQLSAALLPPVALSSVSSQLAADVVMTNPNAFYDGPSVMVAAGTWLVTGAITVNFAGPNMDVTVKLWDGTNTFASGFVSISGSPSTMTFPLSAIVSATTATTYVLSASGTLGGSVIKAAAASNSAGSNASYMQAVRIQ